MVNALRKWSLMAAVVAAAIHLSLAPVDARAQGRGHGGGHGGHGGGGVVVVGGGYYGGWPGYGFGYWGGPWGFGAWDYPTAYYQPEGGIPLGVAMMSGFGGVDLDVKPNRADVWVDGRYTGEARDFDGVPSYLWLKEGVHRLQVYKGGFRTFDEEIEVQRGMKRDLKIKLEAGDSTPPGVKPGEKGASVKVAPKDAEKPKETEKKL
jgi:hypothetical protein